jgi:predicted nucleic acid-binding protein
MGRLTLLDTSAWIEYLRMTGSEINVKVRTMLADGDPIASCDIVIMELLSGTRDKKEWEAIWALMNRTRLLPVRPLFDYQMGASLYKLCRRNGFIPANTNDIMVAAVAIGKEVPLLAAGTDFERISAISLLELDG